MIEQSRGVVRVGGAFPENRILRRDVRFALREAGRRISAVTIDAAEHDVRRVVHVFGVRMTFDAAATFREGCFVRLIN